jgi:hypothetical protein
MAELLAKAKKGGGARERDCTTPDNLCNRWGSKGIAD